MPATLATLASAAVTADCTGADWMVVPWLAWITTWSPSPAAAGKFCVRSVAAACESVPGRLRLELKLLPAATLATATAARASSQAATTVLRRVKHQRAHRAMGNLQRECAGNVPRIRVPWFRPDTLASWACGLDLPSPRWCIAEPRGSRITPAGAPRDHPVGVCQPPLPSLLSIPCVPLTW